MKLINFKDVTAKRIKPRLWIVWLPEGNATVTGTFLKEILRGAR